jgi:hypothetical protein
MAKRTQISGNQDNSGKLILSLFDYSGIWSKPYRDAGYEVIQIDLKLGDDIFEVMANVGGILADDPDFSVYGILAAPPCTDFASSGAAWFKGKDFKPADYNNPRTLEFDNTVEHCIGMVLATLAIIDWLKPKFYAIENPVGRIRTLVPELGDPWFFQPCEFGDPWTKKTGLYGKFNIPVKTPVLALFGSIVQKTGGKSERVKAIRSNTPAGFAKAFFNANK